VLADIPRVKESPGSPEAEVAIGGSLEAPLDILDIISIMQSRKIEMRGYSP